MCDVDNLKVDIFSEKKIRNDDQYLRLARYENPLKIHKVITEKISRLGDGDLLDIGAAAGEFLFNLEKNITNKLTGLEIDQRLIERSKNFIHSRIQQGSVLDGDLFETNQFQIITFLNTHVIFDDLEPVLLNIKKWSSDNADIFIFGAFNPDPVDVWVRYKLSDGSDDRLQYGWNIPSIKTVSSLLTKLFGPNSFDWQNFSIDFQIKKDPQDFLRQRTIRNGDKLMLINGLCQVVYPYILHIKRQSEK